jgi:hypothetical protein
MSPVEPTIDLNTGRRVQPLGKASVCFPFLEHASNSLINAQCQYPGPCIRLQLLLNECIWLYFGSCSVAIAKSMGVHGTL